MPDNKKFYQMTPAERLASLNLSSDNQKILEQTALPTEIANNLTENQISEIEIPLGLCFIRVDDQVYRVPMATEEPSVVAAANNGAKIACNFTTILNERLMTGQIVFHGQNLAALRQKIEANRATIFETAEAAYPSIYKRGGGLKDFSFAKFGDYLSFNCQFDTKDAMGANMINTMLEALAQYFCASLLADNAESWEVLFAILSNDTPACRTIVQTRIPIEKIGEKLAEKIVLASEYAHLDPARAATHNKGIMNGVEAVLLATGNDNRSVVAAIYAMEEPHKAFSSWKCSAGQLIGEIKLSLPVATAGGATQVLPKAKTALEMLGNPDAERLASIIAAVSLANNLAALKALVTNGIQAGHMALQARSLALAVGARPEEVTPLVKALKKAPLIDQASAEKLLQQLRKASTN